jgi:hypothetical protein
MVLVLKANLMFISGLLIDFFLSQNRNCTYLSEDVPSATHWFFFLASFLWS